MQLRLDLRVQVFKTLSAMTDHWLAKGAKRFFADFDRSRDMQFDMFHKGSEIFHKRSEKRKGVIEILIINLILRFEVRLENDSVME